MQFVLLTIWYQFETKFVDWQFKNLDNAAVERIIIKSNHTTKFAEMNYVTYTYNEWRFKKGKSHPGHNILQLKMAH